jgi:hypothetical protein
MSDTRTHLRRKPRKNAVSAAKRRKIYYSDDDSDDEDNAINYSSKSSKYTIDSDDEDTGTQEEPIIINSSSSNEDEYESDFIDDTDEDDEQINAVSELTKSIDENRCKTLKQNIKYLIQNMIGTDQIKCSDTLKKLLNIIDRNEKYKIHTIEKITHKCCVCNRKNHNTDHLFDNDGYVGTLCINRLIHLIEVAEYAYEYGQKKDQYNLKDLEQYHSKFIKFEETLVQINNYITLNGKTTAKFCNY